jgi:hypothetical protein
MNLLKWNSTTDEFNHFAEGEKISAELIDKIIDEDLEITDYEKGIVLTSPNGNKWRLQVSDEGVLLINNIIGL